MNFLSYAVIMVFLSSLVIDCVAMLSGTAAIRQHNTNRPRKGSSSSSNSDEKSAPVPKHFDQLISFIGQDDLVGIIGLLSRYPQLLNFEDPIDSKTPLMRAVVSNKPKAVYLFTRYYNVEGKNKALSEAQRWGHTKIQKILQDEPVSFKRLPFGKYKVEPENYKEFIFAIQKNEYANKAETGVAQILQKNERLLNFQDPALGLTPLMWAVISNHIGMVKFLLQQPNIDVNIKDKNKMGAFDWANKLGYKEIAQAIREKIL